MKLRPQSLPQVLAVDRLYLETDTATGADVDELLETELIVFEA